MQAYAPAPVVAHPAPVAAMAPMSSTAPVLDTATAAIPASCAAPPPTSFAAASPAANGVPLRRRRPQYPGRRRSGRRAMMLAAQGSLPPASAPPLAAPTLSVPPATSVLEGYAAPPPLLTRRPSYARYAGATPRLTKFGREFAMRGARVYKFYTLALNSRLTPLMVLRTALGIKRGQDLAKLESHLRFRKRHKQKQALAQFQAWIRYIVNQLERGTTQGLGLPAAVPMTSYQPVVPIGLV